MTYAGNFFIFMNLSRVASGILCAQAVADNRYKRGWPLGKLPGLKPSMQAIFEIESWLRSMKEFVVAEKEKESLALVKNLNELELYPDEATVREAVPASNQGESDLGLTRGPSLNPVAPEFRPTRTPSPQNNELADVDSQDQEKIRSQMLATLHEAMMEARKKSFQARQERETEAQKRKEMRKREEAHIWVQYWRMSSRLASATTKGRAP
ncbi:hypothetical protein H2203_007344 [Taxawa tesnikishii (nom. ined.)]|nr:hypothetical protein H2203_007344 [Dothideales sp. JES 119]